MGTPEQKKRWAVDWASSKEACGRRVDSVQFSEKDGKERITVKFQDGLALVVEANGKGSFVRAWVRR